MKPSRCGKMPPKVSIIPIVMKIGKQMIVMMAAWQDEGTKPAF